MNHRYTLSPFYQLSPKRKTGVYLHHVLDSETYIINPVVHSYLSFFVGKQITFLKSVALFAKKNDSTSEEVLETVNRFFGDMFHQSILIRAEEYIHLQAFPSQKEAQEKEILQGYHVKKTLSQAYYLSIYLVENIETQSLSVLKILHLNAFFSSDDKQTFKRALLQEIRILEKLKAYSDVVQILQHTDNEVYMTLELENVKGKSLHKFVADNPEMTKDNRAKLLQNVIAAYTHLHDLDILHGDIHGSNILVQEDFSVTLIDFDMAYHNTRKRGEIISKGGVQYYIAPEKISKNAFKVAGKRADFRSEVYQIGVIGYIIFMNNLPFEADSWKRLATKIKTENPSFEQSTLSQSIITFLQRAMHKDPNERFSSAATMIL